jgi:hypothetical protein
MTSEQRLESVKKARKLLNKLPSIGQTIGILNQRLRRCKIDSPRYRAYEEDRNRLLNEQADISFEVKMTLYYLLTSKEQQLFIDDPDGPF